ncbi:MAG: hypothetical protein ACRCSB_03275 [Bacteroidales bacterium]
MKNNLQHYKYLMNLKPLFPLLLSVLSFTGSTFGQTDLRMPFHTTILATNTDLVNKLLLVEVASIPLTVAGNCLNYSLRFRLKHNENALGYQPMTVISTPALRAGRTITEQCEYNQSENDGGPGVLTCNPAAFNADPAAKLRNGDTLIYDMKISSYHLAFKLPDDVQTTDSVQVTIDAELFPTVCRGCGVHGSDRTFDPTLDVEKGCPDIGTDFQACYKRDSREGNWEAWILDKRDCKFYRTVRMPDNRWWFAQNLNYQGTAAKRLIWHTKATTWTDGGSSERLRSFYCPGGPTLPASGVYIGTEGTQFYGDYSSPKAACDVYGVLYPQRVIPTLDGFAKDINDLSRPKDLPGYENMATSTHRGVCPEGWVVPSRGDWGRMANLVEYKCGSGCPTDGSNSPEVEATIKNSPCMHQNTTTNNNIVYSCLFRDLRITTTAPAVKITGQKVAFAGGDPSFQYPDTTRLLSSDTEAIWPYFGQENAGIDRYGFSILPTGYANTAAYVFRGLNAWFGLVNTAMSTATGPTGTGGLGASIIYVTNNYNNISAGFAGNYRQAAHSELNLSVRCLKK